MVSFADDTTTENDTDDKPENKCISFASGTKSESLGLIPSIKGNIITYNIGLLKVGLIYKTALQLIHSYDHNQFDINIPFKHTTNLTLTDSVQSNDGHTLILQLHPQKALVMNDYLDILFVATKSNTINKETNHNQTDTKEMESSDDDDINDSKNDVEIHKMKLKITGKVLRKEQGTPMLKRGVSYLMKGAMYNTDLSATEWE